MGLVAASSRGHGKLAPGDRILAIDHVPLHTRVGSSLAERIHATAGAAVTLTIERAGETRDVLVQPRLVETTRGEAIWHLGTQCTEQDVVIDLGVLQATDRALAYPVDVTQGVLQGVLQVVSLQFIDELTEPVGPSRSIQEVSPRIPELTWARFVSLEMLLAVYYGLYQLLPFPRLDGLRLLRLLAQLVARRRAHPR